MSEVRILPRALQRIGVSGRVTGTIGSPMADPLVTVASLLAPAFDQVAGRSGVDPVVRPSDRAHAQANGALPLAKELGRNPREVAEAVVAAAALDGVASLEVAGPGFINVTFSPGFVASQVTEVAGDDHVGVRPVALPETVVIDYSAPNVAKEMHVGHLRTTLIGDALVRMLEFVGQRVVKENHIGDWGTPFGMLIEHMVDLGGVDTELTIDLSDPSAFYKQARAKFDASDEFKERARARVTLLQSRSDGPTMAIWQKLVDKSADYFDVVYGKLGVLLRRGDIVGESFYQPMMPAMLFSQEYIQDHPEAVEAHHTYGRTLVAAGIDLVSNHFEHTGIQSVTRRIISRAEAA